MNDRLLERVREEWEALGLMSYHGSPASEDGKPWFADLTVEDIEGLRRLLREVGERLTAPEVVCLAWECDHEDQNVLSVWSKRESAEAELARARPRAPGLSYEVQELVVNKTNPALEEVPAAEDGGDGNGPTPVSPGDAGSSSNVRSTGDEAES